MNIEVSGLNMLDRNFRLFPGAISFVCLLGMLSLSAQAKPELNACLKFIEKAKGFEQAGNLVQAEKSYFQALHCNPNVIESQFSESQFGAPLEKFQLPEGLTE